MCLDTSVLVAYLTAEPDAPLANALIQQAIEREVPLVAPYFLWAEVGSVLRKKIRARALLPERARQAWTEFTETQIEFVDTQELRRRAWELAEQFNLPTLYDAIFLACTELAPAADGTPREYWTADAQLVQQLGNAKPTYVRLLSELAPLVTEEDAR